MFAKIAGCLPPMFAIEGDIVLLVEPLRTVL